MVDAFYYGDEEFYSFLSNVRDDLKRIYRKAFERLAQLNTWAHKKKAFRLATTSNKRSGQEFDRIPRENYVYAGDILRLYEEYRKGATPKARPLQLYVGDKLTYRDQRRRVTSYLFNARIADFRKYLEGNDVGRLVARNIRYNLGGGIGRAIRTTYEKSPLDFWYFHNGLTIVCDEFEEKNQVATLINPSVVNGAQTLYSISGSSKKNSSALVNTRIIVRGDRKEEMIEDDEWVQDVIRGVNTQNRVRSFDFRSNEPEQIELQSRFRDQKVFYERKRGEWGEYRNDPRYRGYDRISLKTLGQVLAATSDDDGEGVLLVKRGLDIVFGEKHYQQLFPSRAKVARRFERIYLAYRVYRLLRWHGYGSRSEQRKQRHAFWNTLWLLHQGITSSPRFFSQANVSDIARSFDAFESRGGRGRRARKVFRRAREAVWTAWRAGRRVDPDFWTANNFFKSKFGNRKMLSLVYPKVRADLAALGKAIIDGS